MLWLVVTTYFETTQLNDVLVSGFHFIAVVWACEKKHLTIDHYF